MTRKILFIESNTTGSGEIAITRLLKAGFSVDFLTRKPELYPSLQQAKRGLTLHQIETNDIEQLISFIQSRNTSDIAGVLTFSEYYVAIVAVIAQRFSWTYLNADAALVCRDKFLLRSKLHAAGISTPSFHLCSGAESEAEAADKIGFPLVLKPVDESGSLDVMLINNRQQLASQVSAYKSKFENVRGQVPSNSMLAEGYLEGPEYSVETVSINGKVHVIGIVQKQLGPLPNFVEIAHDFPAKLSEQRRDALLEVVKSALVAISYDYGIAHTEIRWSGGNPTIIEINPRLAGGMIPTLIENAIGIDMLEVTLKLAVGEAVNLEPQKSLFSSIRFITSTENGWLKDVSGLAKARALPLVVDVAFNKVVGEEIRCATSSYQRLGYVISAGPSSSEVLQQLNFAVSQIKIKIGDKELD